MSDTKCLAAETIQKVPVQCLAGCKADRMDKTIKAIPMLVQIDK